MHWIPYLLKVGSGEIPVDEEDWEDVEVTEGLGDIPSPLPIDIEQQLKARRRSSLICPIYNVNITILNMLSPFLV